MTGFADIDTLVAQYNCDSAGVVASELVDQTAFGHDVPLASGTIVYATIDGHECIKLDNTFYFQGLSPIAPSGSIVVVAAVDNSGADGSYEAIITSSPKDVDDDHEGATALTDADWLSSTYERRRIIWASNQPRVSDRIGTAANAATSTAGQLHVLAGAWIPGSPAQIWAARDGETPVTANFGTAHYGSRIGNLWRIGYMKATAITAGKYVGLKRIYVFTGNVLAHVDYATKLAEEQTLWGI